MTPSSERLPPVRERWDLAGTALLETLVREAPVAFAFYDADMRYLRVNRLLAELNGRDVEDHLGRRPRDILPAELAAAVEANLARVLDSGDVHSDADFRRVLPVTGETRFWQSQWFPSRDEAGRVTGVAVLVVDVTDLRRSEEALRRSQQRTEQLQRATAELAAALSVEAVAGVVRGIGRAALGAGWGAVGLLDAGARRVRYIGDPPGGPGVALVDVPEDLPTLTSLALATAEPVYLADPVELLARLPEQRVRALLARSRERAWAVVPLVASGSPIGVLRLAFATPRRLEHEERVFLEALAGQCALAVERSRLYEREHRAAVTLQRSLIPDRLPDPLGFSLAAHYVPGTAGTQVGGDWYDAFPLPSGRLAFVVGDVMGKGLGAAAGMGRVRTALRALALADESPAAVLTGLDRLMTATESEEQIVTLVYGVVDPASGVLVTASAGHPPFVLVRAAADGAGPPELVHATEGATPLGVPEPRVERTVGLRPGDIVVAFSDGLVETRSRGLGEGLDRLAAEVAVAEPAAHGGPGQLPELVDAVVTAMADDPHRADDVTVLALRYDG